MILKLDMRHWGLNVSKVYTNDDPKVTLTHSTMMSNLAKLVFVLIVGPAIRRQVHRSSGFQKHKSSVDLVIWCKFFALDDSVTVFLHSNIYATKFDLVVK